MFDFFQAIFSKIISFVASIIIATGLVSMPAIPEQSVLEKKQPIVSQEIIAENQKIEIKEKSIKSQEIDINMSEINEEILAEIQDVKRENEALDKKAKELKKQNELKEKAIEEERIKAEQLKVEEEIKIQKELREQEELKKQNELKEKAIEEERIKAEQLKVEEELRQQEELKKQKEAEEKLLAEYEAQKKIEEEQLKKEIEQHLLQKIQSNINYYSQQVASIKQRIEQNENSYHAALETRKIEYLNQIDFYKSIYEPDIKKMHREILNEASKDIWTDCSHLRDLWDYQNSYYQRYSTNLNNAERSLINDIHITGGYFATGSYIGEINKYISDLNNGLSELNSLPALDTQSQKKEINNLKNQLESLKSKADETNNYSFSYPPASSNLSAIDALIQEEKFWLSETSCRNLP